MDGMQGAVLGVKLPYLRGWTDARRRHAASYSRLLAGVGDIIVPQEADGRMHVYHLYVIQTRQRDALQSFLGNHGIATGLHYPIPLHLQEAYTFLGYREGDFPVTERVAANGLSLPMFAELTDAQIEYVVRTIKEFFSAQGQSEPIRDEATTSVA
jgi:dTDP-4-amino-4,6-dideoxygalactose transaminase